MAFKVQVTAKDDRELVITRTFNAPRTLVFDAMSKPDMMKEWFHGPPGWTLRTCEIDLRVGGKYRWVWTNQASQEMGMGGEYKEVKRPERIVSTEKFDQAWYPGEAVGTTVLTENKGTTLLTLTVQYNSKETRDAVLASPMKNGLEFGYQRLEEFLAPNGTKPSKAKKENALYTGTSAPEKVDDFMRDLDHPLRDVATALRRSILGMDKVIGEGIFWNAPVFYFTGEMKPFDPKTYKRYIVGFNFFKEDTLRLIFLRGASVNDKSGLLEGDYTDGRRLALFTSLEDVKRKEKDLKNIVTQLLKDMK